MKWLIQYIVEDSPHCIWIAFTPNCFYLTIADYIPANKNEKPMDITNITFIPVIIPFTWNISWVLGSGWLITLIVRLFLFVRLRIKASLT